MSQTTEQSAQDVHAGERFRHSRHDHVVETATVVSLRSDAFGIPHVRFTICFQLPSGRITETERSLSLSSFVGRYREQLD